MTVANAGVEPSHQETVRVAYGPWLLAVYRTRPRPANPLAWKRLMPPCPPEAPSRSLESNRIMVGQLPPASLFLGLVMLSSRGLLGYVHGSCRQSALFARSNDNSVLSHRRLTVPLFRPPRDTPPQCNSTLVPIT
jgi:hypothetical protein